MLRFLVNPRHYEASQRKVLFPFGFGKRYVIIHHKSREHLIQTLLSYTTFHYSAASVSSTKFGPKDTVTVIVNVTNTGHRAGREVVQVYVHDVVSTLRRPLKEPKRLRRTTPLHPVYPENSGIGLLG